MGIVKCKGHGDWGEKRGERQGDIQLFLETTLTSHELNPMCLTENQNVPFFPVCVLAARSRIVCGTIALHPVAIRHGVLRSLSRWGAQFPGQQFPSNFRSNFRGHNTNLGQLKTPDPIFSDLGARVPREGHRGVNVLLRVVGRQLRLPRRRPTSFTRESAVR
jgi:hypothetical protein